MSPSFQLSIISFQSTENELSFTRSSHVIEIIQHALFNTVFYFVFHKISSILFETFCFSWGLTFLKSLLWWALGWCFLLAFINSCYKIAQCLLRDYFPKLVTEDGLNFQFIAKAELSTQEWFIFDRKLLVVKICNDQRINKVE